MELMESKLKDEYEKKLRLTASEYKAEKESFENKLKESIRTEEQLFASAIYEMGSIINSIMVNKRKRVLLKKLAEDYNKGEDIDKSCVLSKVKNYTQYEF